MKKIIVLVALICFIISGCQTTPRSTEGSQGNSIPSISTPDSIVSNVSSPENTESNISALSQPYLNIIRDYKSIIELKRTVSEDEFFELGSTFELSQEFKDAIKNNSNLNVKTDEAALDYVEQMFTPAPNSSVGDHQYGFVIDDINADGVDELILTTLNSSVIAIITTVNGSPYLVDFFFKRYKYLPTTDNKIHILTTGGSSTMSYGIYNMNNGVLTLEFCYGKDFKEGESSVSCFKMDGDEKIWISEEDFNKINAENIAKATELGTITIVT